MDEKEVIKAFEDPANVVESYDLYDTILICPTWYGQEANVQGWHTSFANFSAQEEHRFFTVRNESIASLAYNNMQSADSLDFPFMAFSMGLRFFGPSPNITGMWQQGNGDEGYISYLDTAVGHVFQYDIPRHCSISLKTQQDTRVELTAYACPPGYGPTGGGAALEQTTEAVPTDECQYRQTAQLNMFGTQGVPFITNRFKFPYPLAIPRNGIVEGVLKLSEVARYLLASMDGPRTYFFQKQSSDDASVPFCQRYGIQLSLFGYRLVQQRGQYHH